MWAYLGIVQLFGYPYILSQEWVKLWTSNFVRTFIWSIGTKAQDIIYLVSGGCKCKIVVKYIKTSCIFSADVSYRFHHVFVHYMQILL